MLKKIYQFAIIGAFTFALTACGGEKPAPKTEEEPKTEVTEVPKKEPKAAEELVAEAEVTLAAVGEDMSAISYEPKEFTVAAFTAIKLNFMNQATTEGMNHNAVIIPIDEAVADEIRAAGMKAGGPDFSPTDSRIIAKTKMLLPGESDAITFETPGPGKYHVICTFPGHKAMVAVMIVE